VDCPSAIAFFWSDSGSFSLKRSVIGSVLKLADRGERERLGGLARQFMIWNRVFIAALATLLTLCPCCRRPSKTIAQLNRADFVAQIDALGTRGES